MRCTSSSSQVLEVTGVAQVSKTTAKRHGVADSKARVKVRSGGVANIVGVLNIVTTAQSVVDSVVVNVRRKGRAKPQTSSVGACRSWRPGERCQPLILGVESITIRIGKVVKSTSGRNCISASVGRSNVRCGIQIASHCLETAVKGEIEDVEIVAGW